MRKARVELQAPHHESSVECPQGLKNFPEEETKDPRDTINLPSGGMAHSPEGRTFPQKSPTSLSLPP